MLTTTFTYLDMVPLYRKHLYNDIFESVTYVHPFCDLAGRYKSYDGVPRWLIDKFPESPNPYPWPLEKIEHWEEGYLTQAVSLAFQHLYNNTADAIKRYELTPRH